MTPTQRKKQILRLLVGLQEQNLDNTIYYVPPELSKKIYSLYYILADIQSSKASTQYLIDEISGLHQEVDQDTSSRYELLWNGIVISYTRCFSSNKNLRRLEESIFSTDTRLRRFHKDLVELRNTYIAHREDTYRLEAAVALVVPENVKDNRFEVQMQRHRFDPVELPLYIELFDFVMVEINKIRNKEAVALIQKLMGVGKSFFSENYMPHVIEKLWSDIKKEEQRHLHE